MKALVGQVEYLCKCAIVSGLEHQDVEKHHVLCRSAVLRCNLIRR